MVLGAVGSSCDALFACSIPGHLPARGRWWRGAPGGEGEPLYLDLARVPTSRDVWPLLYAFLGRLSADPRGSRRAYLAGRVVSLLAALGSALLVTHLSRRHAPPGRRLDRWGAVPRVSPHPPGGPTPPVRRSCRDAGPRGWLCSSGGPARPGSTWRPCRCGGCLHQADGLAAVLAIALTLLLSEKAGERRAFAASVAVPCAVILVS